MLDVQRLHFSHDREKNFIRDITFEVKEGEILGFLGPSGRFCIRQKSHKALSSHQALSMIE